MMLFQTMKQRVLRQQTIMKNPTLAAEKYIPSQDDYEAIGSGPPRNLGLAPPGICLLPGEKILLNDEGDSLEVEKIEIGDSVYTYNYVSREFGEYPVSGIIMGYSSGWLEIYFKNIPEPLRCSPGHNMLDEEFNQLPASEL